MNEQRLINANYLLDEMLAGCIPVDDPGISGVTGDESTIRDYIDNTPTEQAISIAWMKEKQDAEQRGSAMWWTIKCLIDEWQKEHTVSKHM